MEKMICFPPFYFFSTILLNAVCYFLLPGFNVIPFPYNFIGITAMVGGIHVLSTSSTLFHQNKTTFRLEKPSAFVLTGYYNISRNPMYLGALIFLVGVAVLTGNVISFLNPALFFVFINWLCIPPEEILMEDTFGRKYVEYKKNVRRWL